MGKNLREVGASVDLSASHHDVLLAYLFLELLNGADFCERETAEDKDYQTTVRVRGLALASNLLEVFIQVLADGFFDNFDNLRRASEHVVPILTFELFGTILPLAFFVDERHGPLHLFPSR